MMAQRIERLVALGFVFSCFQAVHHALDATMLPMGGLSLLAAVQGGCLSFGILRPGEQCILAWFKGNKVRSWSK